MSIFSHKQVSTLPNGLVVASLENMSPVSRVAVYLSAGPRYEAPEELGICHFLRNASQLVSCSLVKDMLPGFQALLHEWCCVIFLKDLLHVHYFEFLIVSKLIVVCLNLTS